MNNNGFLANVNLENGLGFQQGSTDGVYNQYYTGGFHRPQRPEYTRDERNAFNLKGCNKAYKNFYDPDVQYFDYYNRVDGKDTAINTATDGIITKNNELIVNDNAFFINEKIIIKMFLILFIVFCLYYFIYRV